LARKQNKSNKEAQKSYAICFKLMEHPQEACSE